MRVEYKKNPTTLPEHPVLWITTGFPICCLQFCIPVTKLGPAHVGGNLGCSNRNIILCKGKNRLSQRHAQQVSGGPGSLACEPPKWYNHHKSTVFCIINATPRMCIVFYRQGPCTEEFKRSWDPQRALQINEKSPHKEMLVKWLDCVSSMSGYLVSAEYKSQGNRQLY